MVQLDAKGGGTWKSSCTSQATGGRVLPAGVVSSFFRALCQQEPLTRQLSQGSPHPSAVLVGAPPPAQQAALPRTPTHLLPPCSFPCSSGQVCVLFHRPPSHIRLSTDHMAGPSWTVGCSCPHHLPGHTTSEATCQAVLRGWPHSSSSKHPRQKTSLPVSTAKAPPSLTWDFLKTHLHRETRDKSLKTSLALPKGPGVCVLCVRMLCVYVVYVYVVCIYCLCCLCVVFVVYDVCCVFCSLCGSCVCGICCTRCACTLCLYRSAYIGDWGCSASYSAFSSNSSF